MTLSEKQRLFTKNIGLLIAFSYSKKIEMSFGEVYRTPEQQKIYFQTGRSKTMNSRHLDRLAVDFNFFVNDRMLFQDSTKYQLDVALVEILGEYWMTLHPENIWGADWNRNKNEMDERFRDPYHFEMKP